MIPDKQASDPTSARHYVIGVYATEVAPLLEELEELHPGQGAVARDVIASIVVRLFRGEAVSA